jgi:hypothetical protein
MAARYFKTHDDVIVRRRHDRAVPEVLDPKRSKWTAYPQFDELHEGNEISAQDAGVDEAKVKAPLRGA